MQSARVAIIGAGSWGTALAQVFAQAGLEVTLWARDRGLAEQITRTHRNPAYLPGISLHPAIAVTGDLPDAVRGAAVTILAVPTHGLRTVATAAAAHIERDCIVVSAAKGFERPSCATMSQVLGEVLGDRRHVAAISGPNIAPEIARGLPAATVVAATDEAVAANVRDLLTNGQLRVYSSDDLIGVEYGAALKNVVAIAAGICDGLGLGDNGKAAIITRGLAEMARLGMAAGAQPLTFSGLTGLGDCLVTCMSPHSRNRQLGEAIGRGQRLADIEAGMFMVAEGVNAARAARLLAERHGVEMPIVAEVCTVLFDNKPIESAARELMQRHAKDELRELGLHAAG